MNVAAGRGRCRVRKTANWNVETARDNPIATTRVVTEQHAALLGSVAWRLLVLWPWSPRSVWKRSGRARSTPHTRHAPSSRPGRGDPPPRFPVTSRPPLLVTENLLQTAPRPPRHAHARLRFAALPARPATPAEPTGGPRDGPGAPPAGWPPKPRRPPPAGAQMENGLAARPKIDNALAGGHPLASGRAAGLSDLEVIHRGKEIY